MKLSGLYPVGVNPQAQAAVIAFMAAGNFPMSATGIQNAITAYDAVPGNPQLSIYDIGAVWGMTPAQTDAWLAANPGSYSLFSSIPGLSSLSSTGGVMSTITAHPWLSGIATFVLWKFIK